MPVRVLAQDALREKMKKFCSVFFDSVTSPDYGTLNFPLELSARMHEASVETFDAVIDSIDFKRVYVAAQGRHLLNGHDEAQAVCGPCIKEAILEMSSCEGIPCYGVDSKGELRDIYPGEPDFPYPHDEDFLNQ